MNKAKVVMFILAVAAILSMVAIGYFISVRNILGIIASIIVMCFIFITGFKLKRKFREHGLL